MLASISGPGGAFALVYKLQSTGVQALVELAEKDNGNNTLTYNSAGELSGLQFGNASAAGPIQYSYNSARLLSQVNEPDGTVEQITYTGSKVTQLEVILPGQQGVYGYTVAYTGPTATCNTGDVGATTLTPINAADGSPQTYCYTASGTIDAQTAVQSAGDVTGGFTTGSGGSTDATTNVQRAGANETRRTVTRDTTSVPLAFTGPPNPTFEPNKAGVYKLNPSHHVYYAELIAPTGTLAIEAIKNSKGAYTRINWVFQLNPATLIGFVGESPLGGSGSFRNAQRFMTRQPGNS